MSGPPGFGNGLEVPAGRRYSAGKLTILWLWAFGYGCPTVAGNHAPPVPAER
jgi:hypothetical protein